MKTRTIESIRVYWFSKNGYLIKDKLPAYYFQLEIMS